MATQTATKSPGPATYEPPAYPAAQDQNPAPPHQGPIDSRDVGHWNQRINTAINHPSQQLHEASPPSAEKWHASYCGFCSPFDQGLITCCCPCFTFGKTHHRLRWGNHMENYESTNTSCFLFLIASCFGVPCIPIAMQRSDVRSKYNLKGNFCGDICSACCCPACDMMQQEKEAEYRESLRAGQRGMSIAQQYQAEGSMAYPPATFQGQQQHSEK